MLTQAEGMAAMPDGPRSAATGTDPTGRNLLFLREEELRLAQDLLFFGYRDFTAGPDAILAEMGMGRAHHRVLHFVGRRPGVTVGDLLAILGITKQSLARVLQPLIADGYVVQAPGRNDRRQRLLSLTAQGAALERRLFERQREVMTRAYREAGPGAVDGFRRVMHGLMGPGARSQLAQRPEPSAVAPAGTSPAGVPAPPPRRDA